MALPFDGHFNLDAGPDLRVRRGDRGDRDVLLQQRGPAPARGPTNLAVSGVEGDFLPPRLRWRLRREPHVPIVLLDGSPVDLKAHRAPGRSACFLLEQRLPPDERPFV